MTEAALVSPARNCPHCGGAMIPGDKFCPSCGKQWNPALGFIVGRAKSEYKIENVGKIKRGTAILWLLSFVFFVYAVVVYFTQKSNMGVALKNLAGMSPDTVVPEIIEGRHFTVSQLQKQIIFEFWTPVIFYLALAVAMSGLALWSRRSPLPAILIASGLYAAVIVLAGIIDPSSLFQGLVGKFIVITALANGVTASVNLRQNVG